MIASYVPYKPPYRITPKTLQLLESINRKLGAMDFRGGVPLELALQKENKIKTVHASLAIEGNTLSLEQVGDVLGGKRVVGPKHDVQEVKNAAIVYDDLKAWDVGSLASLLKAHAVLMQGLIADSGQWRRGAVGVYARGQIAMAPPAKEVKGLMEDLFTYLHSDGDPWLIKACVFHYELEFIHPFTDGNGRMGRLWQQLLLMNVDALFEYISVEAIIRKSQEDYYRVLKACDTDGECTLFIEFSLKAIQMALDALPITRKRLAPEDRLILGSERLKGRHFSRREHAALFGISGATASRDLMYGVQMGMLTKSGEKALTTYCYEENLHE